MLRPNALLNLDTVDGDIRNQMNSQKTFDKGRFMLCSSDFAKSLGADDRVRSSLFHNQRNGAEGYRKWENLAGFSWIREYPDLPTLLGGDYSAFAADKRAICVCIRQPNYANAVDALGVPKVMDFHSVSDPETNMPMVAASWQEVGTGDVYVSAGLLFGVSCGNQGGAPGTITDSAGLLIPELLTWSSRKMSAFCLTLFRGSRNADAVGIPEREFWCD